MDAGLARTGSAHVCLVPGAHGNMCSTLDEHAPTQAERRCGRCGELKPVDDFAWRRKARGQRDNYCRPCRAAYKQEHYAATASVTSRTRYGGSRSLSWERLAYLVALFKDQPCSDCGETDPLVLEFDHIEAKRFSVSQGIRDRSWQSVMDEIAKCEVVCANCHRRRTARRGGLARSAAVAQR